MLDDSRAASPTDELYHATTRCLQRMPAESWDANVTAVRRAVEQAINDASTAGDAVASDPPVVIGGDTEEKAEEEAEEEVEEEAEEEVAFTTERSFIDGRQFGPWEATSAFAASKRKRDEHTATTVKSARHSKTAQKKARPTDEDDETSEVSQDHTTNSKQEQQPKRSTPRRITAMRARESALEAKIQGGNLPTPSTSPVAAGARDKQSVHSDGMDVATVASEEERRSREPLASGGRQQSCEVEASQEGTTPGAPSSPEITESPPPLMQFKRSVPTLPSRPAMAQTPADQRVSTVSPGAPGEETKRSPARTFGAQIAQRDFTEWVDSMPGGPADTRPEEGETPPPTVHHLRSAIRLPARPAAAANSTHPHTDSTAAPSTSVQPTDAGVEVASPVKPDGETDNDNTQLEEDRTQPGKDEDKDTSLFIVASPNNAGAASVESVNPDPAGFSDENPPTSAPSDPAGPSNGLNPQSPASMFGFIDDEWTTMLRRDFGTSGDADGVGANFDYALRTDDPDFTFAAGGDDSEGYSQHGFHSFDPLLNEGDTTNLNLAEADLGMGSPSASAPNTTYEAQPVEDDLMPFRTPATLSFHQPALQPGPQLALQPGPQLALQPGPQLALQPGPQPALALGQSNEAMLAEAQSNPEHRWHLPKRNYVGLDSGMDNYQFVSWIIEPAVLANQGNYSNRLLSSMGSGSRRNRRPHMYLAKICEISVLEGVQAQLREIRRFGSGSAGPLANPPRVEGAPTQPAAIVAHVRRACYLSGQRASASLEIALNCIQAHEHIAQVMKNKSQETIRAVTEEKRMEAIAGWKDQRYYARHLARTEWSDEVDVNFATEWISNSVRTGAALLKLAEGYGSRGIIGLVAWETGTENWVRSCTAVLDGLREYIARTQPQLPRLLDRFWDDTVMPAREGRAGNFFFLDNADLDDTATRAKGLEYILLGDAGGAFN